MVFEHQNRHGQNDRYFRNGSESVAVQWGNRSTAQRYVAVNSARQKFLHNELGKKLRNTWEKFFLQKLFRVWTALNEDVLNFLVVWQGENNKVSPQTTRNSHLKLYLSIILMALFQFEASICITNEIKRFPAVRQVRDSFFVTGHLISSTPFPFTPSSVT